MRSLLLCVALVAAPAVAKEKFGVKVPDTMDVGGKTLKLNGMGMRTKTIFKVKVYVGSLYLENTSTDVAKILAADEPRFVSMTMLRNLDKKVVGEAIQAGFEKNAGAQLAALKERMDKLIGSLTEFKEGQVMAITYVPGTGTTVKGPSSELTLPGKDFADALFSVWLGKSPVDEDLKKGMLGQD